MKRGVLLLVTLSLSYATLAGGGWVKARQSGYYKLGLSYVTSNGYFAGGNTYSPTLNSSLITASLYTEHGIGERISFEGYLPFYSHHSVSGSILSDDGMRTTIDDAVGGVGDALIGLRFQLFKKDYLAIAGSVKLGLPLGNASLGENGNLFTGDNEFNQIVRIDASVPFGGKTIGGFATLYGGLNNRSKNFSNELLYGAQLGFSYLPAKIWIIGKLSAVKANNETPAEFSNGFTSSMSFTTLVIESSYMLTEKHGLTMSYTTSISGNVLLVAPSVGVGVFIDIK